MVYINRILPSIPTLDVAIHTSKWNRVGEMSDPSAIFSFLLVSAAAVAPFHEHGCLGSSL